MKMNVKNGNNKSNDHFYEVMGYPIPFSFNGKNFSWKEKNPYLKEYLDFIQQWGKTYRNLPFLKNIYLCNSITFNALKADSDIDLLIVTEERRIWTARFFCLLFFSVLRIKRSMRNKVKKFCLSFRVTQQHQNLDAIALEWWDPYLEYRCQHLTPLYQEKKEKNQNYRPFLSSLKEKQIKNIYLGNQIFYWRGVFKKICEFVLWWWIWQIFEFLMRITQKILIKRKIKKDPERNKDVIISNVMLKFYQDKRKEYKQRYLEK